MFAMKKADIGTVFIALYASYMWLTLHAAWLFVAVFLKVCFAGELELVIPFLAEARRQRPFEKLIEPHPELAAQLLG